MAVVFFILYLIACCIFLPRIKFIRESELSAKTILILLLIKFGAGFLLAGINQYFLHGVTDYDVYNNLGMTEYYNLVHQPKLFFTDLFTTKYAAPGEFFGSQYSYWNDLRVSIILKALGLMDIFSRGNYYINSLFFNSLCFFGHIALYRVFARIYPDKNLPVIVGCFLLPSMLYFSSGIHKDLIVFASLGIFCYCLYFSLEQHFTTKRISFLLLSFLIVLFIRNFVAVILLPCATTYFVSKKYSIDVIRTFACMLLIMFTAVAMIKYITPKHDPLTIVIAKQQSFFALGTARSQYKNDTLATSLQSFAAAAPAAIRHSFLSPYPGEFASSFLNAFSAEICLYVVLLILLFICPIKKNIGINSFVLFGLIFAILLFLFIGYITPNAGSLIRYRSIYFPFLLTPVLASIDWQRIFPSK